MTLTDPVETALPNRSVSHTEKTALDFNQFGLLHCGKVIDKHHVWNWNLEGIDWACFAETCSQSNEHFQQRIEIRVNEDTLLNNNFTEWRETQQRLKILLF